MINLVLSKFSNELLAVPVRPSANPANFVVFPDNHDMSRFYTQVNEDFDLFKMGMVYVYTMRGIPQIYYGTEILMTNPGTEDHGIIRSDFPGGWLQDTINAFTGVGLSARQLEAQSLLRRLGQWRKTSMAVQKGKLMHFVPENEVYVYFRYHESEKIMVILNKNKKAISLNMDRFAEILAGESTGEDVLSLKTYDLARTVPVSPRSALVLQLKK